MAIVKVKNRNGGVERLDITERRDVVIGHILISSPDFYAGRQEKMEARIDQQDRVLRAILEGVTSKTFLRIIKNMGLKVTR